MPLVKQAYIDKDFDKVIELRGKGFRSNLEMYKKMKKNIPQTDENTGLRFGLLNVGAPAGGTNAANASYVKAVLAEGHRVVAFQVHK